MAATLVARKREDLTKSHTKKLREEGFVPGIVYGQSEEPQTIAVEGNNFYKLIRDQGRNSVLSLEIENESPLSVMLHEYQTNPIVGDLIHIDLYVVNMSQEMDVEVPLRVDGEAQVSKSGGVVQQPLYQLQVRGKPGSFPEEIVVDVSELEIGDSLTIADLPENNKYEFLDEQDATIATVIAPDDVEDLETPSEEDAEPELVNEKKGDDEE